MCPYEQNPSRNLEEKKTEWLEQEGEDVYGTRLTSPITLNSVGDRSLKI